MITHLISRCMLVVIASHRLFNLPVVVSRPRRRELHVPEPRAREKTVVADNLSLPNREASTPSLLPTYACGNTAAPRFSLPVR